MCDSADEIATTDAEGRFRERPTMAFLNTQYWSKRLQASPSIWIHQISPLNRLYARSAE